MRRGQSRRFERPEMRLEISFGGASAEGLQLAYLLLWPEWPVNSYGVPAGVGESILSILKGSGNITVVSE